MTDKEYEAKRNQLIPIAQAHADDLEGSCCAKDVCDYHEWTDRWSRAYLGKMTELAEQIK